MDHFSNMSNSDDSHRDISDSRSDILRRFEDSRNRSNMFFERAGNFPRWPQSSFMGSHFGDRIGRMNTSSTPQPKRTTDIPINVVHQNSADIDSGAGSSLVHTTDSLQKDISQSVPTTETEHLKESHADQEESMDESNVHEVTEPNTEEHRSSPQTGRVHRIPIHVERREEKSNSSVSRSSSSSSQRSMVSNQTSLRSSSPSASTGSPKGSPNPGARVFNVPIKVERDVKSRKPFTPPEPKNNVRRNIRDVNINMKNAAPLPGQEQSASRKNIPQKSDSASGPYVSRIAVSTPDSSEFESRKTEEGNEPSDFKQMKRDQMIIIAEIDNEIANFAKEVEIFNDEFQGKHYLYLDEMFTRCMIKLDNVDAHGRDDVRQARKLSISRINQCLAMLESRSFKHTKEATDDDATINQPLEEETPANKESSADENVDSMKESIVNENGENCNQQSVDELKKV